MKLRLNRYLSLCGLASRRKAEILIESGEIIVNGKSYNSYMAYQGLENDEIADIMNYILNEWGNNSEEFVTFERVNKVEKSILK